MSDPEHEDYQLFILDVVDDSVIANANAELPVTALQLDASRRAWLFGERPDRFEQSTGRLHIELPNDFRR